ncbi:hypothetical protein HZC33_03435 [Candidatus Wolfebacteria bacterium]|nr:hypothetical protein [Candidatus Wolfebacteria bacterium]
MNIDPTKLGEIIGDAIAIKISEDFIRDHIDENCYTTPKEKNPRKPLMFIMGCLTKNPYFEIQLAQIERKKQVILEVEKRKQRPGTLIFLKFDTLCDIHQLDNMSHQEIEPMLGNEIRDHIIETLREEFIKAFDKTFFEQSAGKIIHDTNQHLRANKKILRIKIYPKSQHELNNGEIYFLLPEIALEENFIFVMLEKFKKQIEKTQKSFVWPNNKDEIYELKFNGFGFGYY